MIWGAKGEHRVEVTGWKRGRNCGVEKAYVIAQLYRSELEWVEVGGLRFGWLQLFLPLWR